MPSRKNKQPKKSSRAKTQGQRRRKSSPTFMGALGKGAMSALKAALPGMLRAVMPFPTSGAYAMASPGLATDTALSAPVSNGSIIRTTKASIDTNNDGITVRHREFITDISPSYVGGFQVLVAQAINPKNSALFPWLSGIVNRYESYKFGLLKFIYEPQCSTSTSGTIMMAVDYDVDDPEPSSKVQMMSYKGAARSPPWFAGCNMSASSDLSRQKSFFITQKAGSESRLSNVGNFYLAYEGQEAVTMGELYVEYEVRLSTPTLETDSGQSSTYYGSGYYGDSGPQSTWTTFGDPQYTRVLGNLPVTTMNLETSEQSTTMGITIPTAGTYLLNMIFSYEGTNNLNNEITPVFSSTSGVTFTNNFFSEVSEYQDVNTPTFSRTCMFNAFQTTQAEQVVSLTLTSATSQLSSADLSFLMNITVIPNSSLVPTFLSAPTPGSSSLALRDKRIRSKWDTSKSVNFKVAPSPNKAVTASRGEKEEDATSFKRAPSKEVVGLSTYSRFEEYSPSIGGRGKK